MEIKIKITHFKLVNYIHFYPTSYLPNTYEIVTTVDWKLFRTMIRLNLTINEIYDKLGEIESMIGLTEDRN